MRPAIAVLLGSLALASPRAAVAEQPTFTSAQHEFFENRIRPLLVQRCLKCHGSKKQESDLRLDSRRALLAGGDNGEAAVVGKPAESLLIEAVRRAGDLKMPPDKPLAKTEIEALAAWIKMGLPWPASDVKTPEVLSHQQRLQYARRTHWALQPVRLPTPPEVKDAAWCETPLDRFVLARLEEAKLTPSPPANRRTLIRRATFDLLGLPPTPREVNAFVDDPAPDAFARLIDRLLASPHYGERWGRHWLDVARYSDTRGYSFGRERRFPYAYTYRDYVIRAFNSDLPYDRFVTEQLAADRLAGDEKPAYLAAMGFLTVGRKYSNKHDDIDDQIDVVTRGLLGLTVGCARCHDHKYDAIFSEDYYSLYGIFASSREPSSLPLIGDPADSPGYDAFKHELEKRQKTFDTFSDAKHAELLDVSRRRVTDYLVRVVSKQPETILQKLPFISLSREDLKPKLVARWRGYIERNAKAGHAVFGPWRELVKLDEKDFVARAAELVTQWDKLPAGTGNGQLNPLVKRALNAEPLTSKIEVARVYGTLLSGVYVEWKKRGSKTEELTGGPAERSQLLQMVLGDGSPTNVARRDLLGYLSRADRNKYRELQKQIDSHQVNSPGAPPRGMVLVDLPSPYNPRVFLRGKASRPGKSVPRRFPQLISAESAQPYTNGSGRLELARAIVDPANPLTARVIVNRVWMHHFGEPLVTTPSDFGTRADPPSHPLLLDYLAWRLSRGGWSIKDLHRRIMLSAVYQQTSVDRPDARKIDPENRLLWRMNRRRLEFEAMRDALLSVAGRLDPMMGGKPVDIYRAPFRPRRSVYGMIDRQDLPGLLRVFDFASPDQSSPRRPRTIVPQQALFFMNSPFVIQQAEALAARPEVAGESDSTKRVAAIYQIVLTRTPSADESAAAVKFVSAAKTSSGGLSPWVQYAQLLMLTNEFMFVD
ncbi:MAG: PSD1 domain-containing protein [Planctomycetes bacterium]|nr:PSD1 domain-containing protein [Planctomycetota bacterium]